MLKNISSDKFDLLIYLTKLPIVDDFDDELTVKLQSELEGYLQILRSMNNVG